MEREWGIRTMHRNTFAHRYIHIERERERVKKIKYFLVARLLLETYQHKKRNMNLCLWIFRLKFLRIQNKNANRTSTMSKWISTERQNGMRERARARECERTNTNKREYSHNVTEQILFFSVLLYRCHCPCVCVRVCHVNAPFLEFIHFCFAIVRFLLQPMSWEQLKFIDGTSRDDEISSIICSLFSLFAFCSSVVNSRVIVCMCSVLVYVLLSFFSSQ